MACIHFKFKNSLDYDSITFDGLHIALGDLKRAIMNRKKLRDTDDDLQIINAITKKAYSNEEEMIPKNSSVIVARIPVSNAAPRNGPKTLNHPNAYKEDPKPVKKPPVEIQVSKAPDLSEMGNLVNAKATEEEKIKAMIIQSTKEFDPSNYVTGTKRVPVGAPSPTYICKKCGKSGHFIQNCPVDPGEAIDKDKIAKRPTGIPHSFLTVTDDPNAKGALYLSPGQYGVPTIDKEAYEMKKKERPPFLPDDEKQPEPKKEEIPSELLCPLCKDLLTDAVLIPCCGSSFCDECIRDLLLESEDQKCPQCHETDNSPDRLIANKSLRSAVMNFQNETGYTKITKSMKQAHEKRLAEKKLEEKKLAEERKQAAKSVTQEKNGTVTSSENMGKIRSIPTYQQTHDGKHHRQWSPSKYKPRREDAPAVVSKHDAQPALPNLTVTTATSSVPGGMSPPTPCKDEKEQQPLEKSSNSLLPMSQPPVSSQSSGQPILSAVPSNAIRPSVPLPQPLPTIRPAVIPASFPPAAPIQTIGIQYRPQVPMVNPAIPPPFPGPPPPGVFGPGPRYPPPGPPFPVAPPVRPLTKEEFYRTQKKLQEKEIKKKKSDPLDDFARELMEYSRDQKKRQPVKSSSRSRSKSRSRTPAKRSLSPRNRSRTRSRSFTPRKRSYTPRSRTRSRSRSPYGKGPYKSRSRTRSPRYRSRSRSRSFTPRFRSRSPRPRTYSRSPPPRYRSRSRSPLPRWRSRSRTPVRYDRWTPPPYGARRRSRSPGPYYRGRSRSPLPPPYDYYKPEWEQPPYHDYHDYRDKGRRGRGGHPAYPYPPDSYRFDPRAYDEFSQEFVQRYGILPPPPVMVAQHQHPYEAPPYRGPRRSRSPRDKRPLKDRPPRKTRDDKKPKSPTKTVDKKTEKKTTSKSSDKKDEKKKIEKRGASEKTVDSKKKEMKSDKVKKEKVEKQKQKKVVKTEKKEESEIAVKEEKVVNNEDVKNDGGKEKEEGTEKDQNPDVNVKVEDVKVENDGVDKSDTQDKVQEKVGSVKEDKVKTKKKGKPKKLSGSKVNSEVESSQGESEKERKPKRKHKKISKSLVKGEAVVNDNEADESPAKRIKTEEQSGMDGHDDQLMLSPPILSKWEKEDSSEDVSPRRSRRHSPEIHGSVKDRKMLPRSVIERAEKALSQKQPQPISIASSVKSISNVAARLEESPPIIRSPEGSAMLRRVTMDSSESSATKRVEEDSRKVLSRDRSMQIIVSSDNKERSKGKEKEVKDLRVSLMEKREKRASERERTVSSEERNWDTYKKSYGHDTRDFDYSRDKDWDNPKDNWGENGWLSGKSKENRVSKVKTSKSASVDKDERSKGRQKIEKDVSKETRKQEEMELSKIRKQHSKSYEKKEDKSDRKGERKDEKRVEERLQKFEESRKGDEKVASGNQKNVEDKAVKADEKVKKDNRTVVSKEEKGRVEPGPSNKSEKPKAQDRNDRKESVIDESSFEPDYNEAMGSESEDEKKQVLKRQYSTAESEKVESDKADSESEEDSDDKKHKKKKSKHKKHKKNKKKHKKKHKKQKDDDDSS